LIQESSVAEETEKVDLSKIESQMNEMTQNMAQILAELVSIGNKIDDIFN
tara:strand:- start:192 stop:341 length:150 start_codon:yes stop_codon:yes gene_type:complete